MSAWPPRRLAGVAPVVLAISILTGCGGSGGGKAPQQVTGPGFRFEVPKDWKVVRSGNRVSAGSGTELLQVATFTLLKPYSAALFSKVAKELEQRMTAVAGQTGGKLAAPAVVTTAGVKSHSYRVKSSDRVDEYTFVLRGRREYQLLCRRAASGNDDVCRQLLQTFSLG